MPVWINEDEEVIWYCIDISKIGDEKILREKIMSLSEYNIFIQTLASMEIEKAKVLRRKDIFEAIFKMYLN